MNFPTIHFNGKDGTNGTSKGATGRNGESVFIKVPLGTIITDLSSTATAGAYDAYTPEEVEALLLADDEDAVLSEERKKEIRLAQAAQPTGNGEAPLNACPRCQCPADP